MNLMLLWNAEVLADSSFKLTANDRRARHIQQVLQLQPGDSLKAGIIDGLMGKATLQSIENNALVFTSHFHELPPAPLDLTLIIGLPRPKMMRRIIQSVSALGVKDIVFVNTYKVEKSYWQTPWLSPQNLIEQSLLGLEQAVDTQIPRISQFKLFKPFVEDHLQVIMNGREGWFAHPGMFAPVPETPKKMVLVIGPEGGLTPYEVDKLRTAGLRGFHFGRRILRMETAIPAILGRLFF